MGSENAGDTVDEMQAIYQEILDLTETRIRRPGEVIATEFAEFMGISFEMAKRRLNRMVKQGLMQSAKAYDADRGRSVRVYWRVRDG